MAQLQSYIRGAGLKKTTASSSTEFLFIGRCTYQQAEQFQRLTHEKVLTHSDLTGTILGFEFDPVITLGIRGTLQDVYMETQSDSEIEVISTDRGGQATLHNPGQLVIYPIVHLGRAQIGVKAFIERLEETTRLTLAELGVQAQYRPGVAGVFTEKGKIASVGVRVSRHVTLHGLALNVSNDLQPFAKIRVCGASSQVMDRVVDWDGQGVRSLQQVFELWCKVWSVRKFDPIV